VNESDVLDRVRDSLSGVHMHAPVEAIVVRAAAGRRRRRAALAGAGAGAAAVALSLGLLAANGTGSPAPIGAGGARLTAFSVGTGPNGASTLTLRKGAQYRLDPDALRQALAQHGIPAVVNIDRMCDSAPEPDGLDQVISSRRLADGSVFITFDPAALPTGSEVSIGYFASRTEFALIESGAPLHCTTSPSQGAQAAASGDGAHATPAGSAPATP
jgi:hypothetical protein